MEDFYRRLLAGEGRAEALRQAQLAMKAKHPDPFYWGAFICQGNPSPLSQVESREDRADVLAG
jgi:CHAT domain-containing protein